jgi:carbamate kinase
MSAPDGSRTLRSVRVLVALGGNAMTRADGLARPQDQIAAIRAAMEPVADLVARGHDVVLTHGNGPQVGNLLVKNELAASVVPPVPLDWCGAQTQATIGFVVLNALEFALAARAVRRPVAAVVTRTLVDGADPGFAAPSKPIGRYLPAAEASVLVSHGETWQDRGARGWRRVVASPEPLEVLDAPAVVALVGAGFVVVANGGGGIPCVRDPDGRLRGVEAVVDKDLGAALLGRAVRADVLVIATDVGHVATAWATPDQTDLDDVPVSVLRKLAEQGSFAAGSMGPKVEAACRFVEAGGTRAAICSLDAIADAAHGRAGTVVHT